MKTQVQQIRKHLRAGNSITSFESYIDFGITQLGRVLDDIEREDGIVLDRKWIKNNGKMFKRYSWPKGQVNLFGFPVKSPAD